MDHPRTARPKERAKPVAHNSGIKVIVIVSLLLSVAFITNRDLVQFIKDGVKSLKRGRVATYRVQQKESYCLKTHCTDVYNAENPRKMSNVARNFLFYCILY
jgi:hypothetical protein